MSIRLAFGSRVFAPSWPFTVLAVLLGVVFILLGNWQWRRGQMRQAEYDSFAAGAGQVIALGSRSVAEVARFQQVSVIGRFDPEHQFLLDNRTNQGRAGYEVLTPLRRPEGQVLLVDRGWVPFSGIRSRLPAVAIEPRGGVTAVGRVDNLPVAGLASGRVPPAVQDPWPKVTGFPTMQQLSAALGVPLEPSVLLLDPGQPDGYVRDWHPPGMEPMRHWSYAAQWWCFALVLFVLWAGLSTRKVPQLP